MRRGKELDDGLDRAGQGADGDIDTRQKTDQGAQDRTGRGKGIDAFKPGDQVEHGDSGCYGREDNHAQGPQQHQGGRQVAIPGENIDCSKQKGEDCESQTDQDAASQITGNQSPCFQGRDSKILIDPLPPVIDHGPQGPQGSCDGCHRQKSAHDPGIHEIFCARQLAKTRRHHIAQKENIKTQDDEDRQQGEENGTLIPEKDEEVASD